MISISRCSKLIAITLIASQIGFVSAGTAAFADSQVVSTPEMQLLTEAMFASSQNLAQADMSKAVSAAISNYDKTAEQQGREDRMIEALIQMKFMSPARAQEFRATVDASLKEQLASGKQDGNALVSQALATTISQQKGAQFSGGTACWGGAWLGIAGLATVFTGAFMAAYNPTCSTDSWRTYYSDGTSSITYGRTECSADYHPDAKAGRQVMLYGGIAVGLGALLYLLTANNFSCD